MTVQAAVSPVVNPALYESIRRCLEWIHAHYDVSGRKDMHKLMIELFNVNIHPLTKQNDGTNVHYVEFESEQAYSWFLLRWA